eukprot:2916949-Ditylum_brightwellii.AAC.1
MDFKCGYVILICKAGDQYTISLIPGKPVLSFTTVYYTGGGVQYSLTTGPGLPGLRGAGPRQHRLSWLPHNM